jgi:pantoate--beta-alanine ligase
MQVAKTTEELQSMLLNIPREKRGFVPTMGALHPGHKSLITKAVNNGNQVIASVFVNRLQFNNTEDFNNYPKSPELDLQMLAEAGCEIVFMPEESDLFSTEQPLKKYNLGYLETTMEGKFRPGHFQGVAQVVHRLFTLTNPAMAYFGEKDFQQCMVIDKLIELEELGVKLVRCPIIREADGLAMSSRNKRLDAKSRILAAEIYRSLSRLRETILGGNSSEIMCQEEISRLESKAISVEYLQICREDSLEVASLIPPKPKGLRIFVAAYVGGIRLIDNLSVSNED